MTTTTIVAHDAHVACRATFVAARTAMVQVATTRRAAKAARNAAYAANRRATKAQRAANVAAKEAAEKHASIVNKWTARCAARAAARAAAAPMVRAAKRTASMIAKVVKAANALRLAAIRVSRAAPRSTAVIKAAIVAIDKAYALSVTPVHAVPVTPATSVHATRKGPTVGLSLEEKVMFKAMRLGARRGATKAPVVYSLNSAEVRDSITARDRARAAGRAAQRAAEAALLAAMVHKHQATGLSLATIEARAAQGAAQKAANNARKAGMPAKVGVVHTPIVRTGPTKVRGVKRTKVYHMAHTVESALAQVAKKEAIVKAKEDKEIAKARRWALRKAAFANRKEAMEKIAADAWMMKGVWLSEDLIRAANDWSYQVRISAFKEARNIAYAKAPVAQVAVAA